MSGKEIKDYILKRDDLYYNIVILNENKERIKFNDIIDDIKYNFTKMEEYKIGCGMVMAYYNISIKN